MSNLATRAQAGFTQRVQKYGNTTSVEGQKAFLFTNERDMVRLLKVDGDLPELVTAVLVFSGTQHGTLVGGARITQGNVNYRVESEHPEILQDICVYLALACKEE